ncbi:MAG: hypothetical protein AAFQ81_05150 [Pseudomonadota bacterium]
MSASTACQGLEARLAETLSAPVEPAVEAVAEALMARPGALAVLFYGAALRDPAEALRPGAGPADFYLLTTPSAVGPLGRLLPPDVSLCPEGPNGAKVASMSLPAFARRMRRGGYDTTVWARFSQPARLVRARDPETAHAVTAAIAEGVRTARWWTAHLVEGAGQDPLADWAALYSFTYGAELRVERGGTRASSVVDANPEWFRALASHVPLPPAARPARAAAARAWARRRGAGKLLNLLRLAKASLTYSGGIAYALAKVERHSGRPVALTAWQRRWPALAAPLVLWRLWREGRLR